MSNKPSIVITIADDWEALYINGRIVAQDHEISRDTLLYHLNQYEVLTTEVHEVPAYHDPQLESNGRFPIEIRDVMPDDDKDIELVRPKREKE
jgi:hypothetical protein